MNRLHIKACEALTELKTLFKLQNEREGFDTDLSYDLLMNYIILCIFHVKIKHRITTCTILRHFYLLPRIQNSQFLAKILILFKLEVVCPTSV